MSLFTYDSCSFLGLERLPCAPFLSIYLILYHQRRNHGDICFINICFLPPLRRQVLKQKQKEEVETRPPNVSSAFVQNKHRQESAEFEKNIEDELKRNDMKLLLEVRRRLNASFVIVQKRLSMWALCVRVRTRAWLVQTEDKRFPRSIFS